jgi:hypothetical protein
MVTVRILKKNQFRENEEMSLRLLEQNIRVTRKPHKKSSSCPKDFRNLSSFLSDFLSSFLLPPSLLPPLKKKVVHTSTLEGSPAFCIGTDTSWPPKAKETVDGLLSQVRGLGRYFPVEGKSL